MIKSGLFLRTEGLLPTREKQLYRKQGEVERLKCSVTDNGSAPTAPSLFGRNLYCQNVLVKANTVVYVKIPNAQVANLNR